MRLKQKFEGRGILFGLFAKLPAPALTELMGISGFDFVIIDTEHGPLDMMVAEDMIRAAELHNLSTIVRITENNPALISKALDIGADAVQIPHINNREAAEKAVEAAKFYPKGERGVCRFVRAAGYSSMESGEYFASANADTQIIIQIEGEEGIKNFDEILGVDNIDVFFIGPYDLSQSLGLTGQVDHPKVISEMETMVNKAKARNKKIGIFTDSFEITKKWIEAGVQYVSYSVDTGIIFQSFKDIADELSKERDEFKISVRGDVSNGKNLLG